MLNVYKQNFVNTFPNTEYNPNIWFVMTSALGNVSRDILTNDTSNMEYNVMVILYIIIKLSYVFNVDLDKQWIDWKRKACKKKYFRGYQQQQIQESSSYSSKVN